MTGKKGQEDCAGCSFLVVYSTKCFPMSHVFLVGRRWAGGNRLHACTQGKAAVGCAFSLPKTELGTLVGAGLMACRAAGLLSGARSRRPFAWQAGRRAGETYLRLGGPHSRLGSPLGTRYVLSSNGPSCPWCRQSSSLVGDNAGPVPCLPLITTAAAPTTQHCRC